MQSNENSSECVLLYGKKNEVKWDKKLSTLGFQINLNSNIEIYFLCNFHANQRTNEDNPAISHSGLRSLLFPNDLPDFNLEHKI